MTLRSTTEIATKYTSTTPEETKESIRCNRSLHHRTCRPESVTIVQTQVRRRREYLDNIACLSFPATHVTERLNKLCVSCKTQSAPNLRGTHPPHPLLSQHHTMHVCKIMSSYWNLFGMVPALRSCRTPASICWACGR